MARSRSRSPARERKRHRSRSVDRADRNKPLDKDREHKRRKERSRSRSRDRKDRRIRDRSRSRDRDRKKDKDRDRNGKDQKANGDASKEDGELLGDSVKQNGNAEAKKVEPLSLEELLKKKKEDQERLSKPVFLTKKQREELALKRREEAAQAEKKRVDDIRKAHEVYLDNVKRDQRDAERRREEEERKRREEERERQKELELIKQQYLGGDKVKKKVLKPSEKFRFNFDWDAGDDTSRDLNPLYNNPHEAILLFGRGLRAGMDRREQKKAAADHERDLLKKLRDANGVKETREDRRRDRDRERAADKYDAFDMKVELHWTEKKREDMSERDWRIFREDFNISYKGTNPALPIRNWEEANLPDPLMKAVKRHGYKKPSPIQMAAIPLGLQQRDVIGVAETGSGKTAAFVLPMLVYIMRQPVMLGNAEVEAEGPYAVVMAPTRELAQQIEEETKQLMHYTDFRVVSVVGGQSIEDQGFQLRKGCEIVVATPGRLLDCLERSYAVLNQCNYLVLDEADRMIDMGFEPQVLGVLEAMPSTNLKPENEDVCDQDRVYRTTYMFSATMPPAVERLARKYLRRPVVITIGSAGKTTDNVTQRVVVIKENEKPFHLETELELIDEKRAIVFVNTKKQCDFVSRHLEGLGYRCTVLHGGKTQEQRETSLQGFREEKFNVLVATDVAGRGIDVPDVALVINYDMPNNIENYTHRIGRTGRAGRKGTSITLLTLGDTDIFYDLKKFLEDNNAHVPPQLAHHEAAKVKPGGFDRPRRDQTVFVK